jgi:glycerol kinase
MLESTALGAAALAGLASGFWPDAAALDAEWRAERVFEPAMDPALRARLREGWQRALARAKEWEGETVKR